MQTKRQINFYLILNISPKASHSEIKSAYMRLVKIYHPDKNRGSRLAEKKFKQIQKAWEVLKDSKKRKVFDEKLKAQKSRPAHAEQTQDNLADKLKQKREESPIDLEFDLQVSLEDICQSRLKKINYLKPVNGKKIQSSFTLQVPWGVKPGTQLKFKGEGGAEGVKEFGDLFIRIQFKPHKIFHRTKESEDLFLEQPIPFVSAIQGGKLKAPSPYGILTLNLVPPLKNKKILKIKGQGLPKNSKGEKGDLFIKILIEYPAENKTGIQKQIEEMPFEKQKIYVEKFKDSNYIYPKVLKFQKKIQELKKKI